MQKYITNISALQFIQLLRFSTLFLIGIVFARIYSTQQIGYYETLIFIAGACSFFWLSGVLQSFLSLIKQSNNEEQIKNSSHFFNSFVVLLGLSILSVLLLIALRQSLAGFLNNHQPIVYFKWLLLYVFFGSPANFIEYVYLGFNQPKKIITYGLISQIAQTACIIIPTLLGFDIEVSIIGLVLINVLRFVWLVIILIKYTKCKLSGSFIKSHLTLSYPLIISTLLSGSAQYIDGLMVTHFYDSTMFAVFRYGAREFPIALIMANAFSNAMIPEFSSQSFNDTLAKLKRNTTRLIHILFPLSIGLIIVSNWLFPIIFSADFELSAKIFNIYLLLVIFRVLFPQTILIGKQKTKAFLWVSSVEIAVNVILSLIFIKLFGILGVAYATLIAYLVEKLILILLVKKWFAVNIKSYLPIELYFFYSIFAVTIYIIVDFYIFC